MITGVLQGTRTLTPSLDTLGLKSGDHVSYLNPWINSVKVEQNKYVAVFLNTGPVFMRAFPLKMKEKIPIITAE